MTLTTSTPPRVHTLLMGVLAFLGFVDAGYLSVHRLIGTPLFCGASNACAIVTNSEYSAIFGIPNSYLGALFYATVFFLMIAARTENSGRLFAAGAVIGLLGLLASGWLLYAQAYLIGVFCPYCVASATISTLISLIGIHGLWKMRGR